MVWAIVSAAVLWVTPAWATQQDTGYPWFADVAEEDSQTISESNTSFQLVPVLPTEQDTGYPWFADIKEDKVIMKPVEVFGVHPPTTVEEDTGYPWHVDTKDDNPNAPQPGTVTQ